MRLVKRRSFRDFFKGKDPEEPWANVGFDFETLFYRNRHLYNRISLLIFLLVSSVILAFSGRAAQVLLASELIFLAVLFLKTRKIAENIYIQRFAPAVGVEQKKLKVIFELRNASGFSISDVFLRDSFSGTRNAQALQVHLLEILPLSVHRSEIEVMCDGGMGMHHFGPLVVIVSDPLGLFQFMVLETDLQAVDVLPETILLPDFNLPAAMQSSSSGFNESAIAGQSVEFLRVREYRPGDPIKQMNWRLSAKHREPIINEFEKTVNTSLTICLDFSEQNHVGRKDQSTWEYEKDVAISVIQEVLPKASRTQLLSQNVWLPFGRGSEHQKVMIDTVSHLRPLKGKSGPDLIWTAAEGIPFGSTLIYIAPLFDDKTAELSRCISMLQDQAVRWVMIVLDAASFLNETPKDLGEVYLIGLRTRCQTALQSLLVRNAHVGIETYVVSSDLSVAQALARPRVS